jgi:EmrB/QacA subfamily drug resistance transporter
MDNKHTSHWIILIILALAQFMVILDSSIVNVAIPSIERAFHLVPSTLQWIVTAYTLAFGGFLLLGGRAADLYGRRKVFLSGVAFFSLVSLLDGLSSSGGMLIALRGLQGLAGAFMSPAALSIVLVTYREGHERNVALSVWGAVAAGGAAVGLLLGGILTQYLGWRWNFFINVPIGIFVLISAYRLVPKHEYEAKDNNLDLFGALLATSGPMLLVYGLVKAPTVGWTAHSSLIYFGLSLLFMLIFAFNESRVKHPLVPLSIFKNRNLLGANLIQLPIAAGLFSVFFFSTLYFQNILHYTPIRTGVAFLIVPLAIMITASQAPKLIKKYGYKRILSITPLISAVGLFMLSDIPLHSQYWTHVVPGIFILGLGLGATFVSLLSAATSGVRGDQSGLASGIINTTQQIGGSLGLAVLTGVTASVAASYVKSVKITNSLTTATGLVHGYRRGFFLAGCFNIFAALVAFFVIKQKTKDKADELVTPIA